MQRPWHKLFVERIASRPPEQWCYVGIDIGKFEHVAVAYDGQGQYLAGPYRFGVRRADCDAFFAWVSQAAGGQRRPLFGLEPTGHYYEPLAYEIGCAYSVEQLYLIQSTDVAHRRGEWSRGGFKNDEVDACVICELLRTGNGRPYQPPVGVYLRLFLLERYRLGREQLSTRLKNQIVRHVDYLYPGLVIPDRGLAERYPPLFHSLWDSATPAAFLALCADPRRLRQHDAESLYQLFRQAGHWMTRPYAAQILARTQALCLPAPELAQPHGAFLAQDLALLAQVEREMAQLDAAMVDRLDQTWGRWLRPTRVDPARLAGLVAAIGDLRPYRSARQLFGRSGLHSRTADSGTRQRRGQGQRMVRAGDRHLRRQLWRFTDAMLARYPGLRTYYTQLRQRGKRHITAHIAVARKLTGIVFAVGTRQVPFDPHTLA
jgi:hypothetical protein